MGYFRVFMKPHRAPECEPIPLPPYPESLPTCMTDSPAWATTAPERDAPAWPTQLPMGPLNDDDDGQDTTPSSAHQQTQPSSTQQCRDGAAAA